MLSKKTIFISFATLVQLLLGFILQIVIASKLGFNKELDIYLVVISIGNIIILVFDSAMIYGVTAWFTLMFKLGQLKKLTVVSNSLLNLSLISISIIVFLLHFFIVFIASLISKDCCSSLEALMVTKEISLYYSLGIIFAVASLIGLALNYAHARFYLSSIAIVADIFVQLLLVFNFTDSMGARALSMAFLAGQCVKAILLLAPFFRYYRFSFKFYLIKKKVYSNVLPLSFSSGYSNLSSVIDKHYASMLTPGNVSILQYSGYLASAVSSIMSKGMSIVSLNSISSLNIHNQHQIIVKSIKMTTILFLVYLVLFLGVGERVLQILFKYSHKVNSESVHMIYKLVLILSVQIFAGVIASILNNLFYNNHRVALISKISIFAQTANLFLKIFIFSSFGVVGLAWNTSTYYFLSLLILIYYYFRIYHEEKLKLEA